MTEITPVPLLEPAIVHRQAASWRVEPAGVEQLAAIDSVLRALLGAGALEGWALHGPTALHGVYGWSSIRPRRIPDELTFAPVSDSPRLDADELARAVARSLPDGQPVETASAAAAARVWQVGYSGTEGASRELRLRLLSQPLRARPPAATLPAALTVHPVVGAAEVSATGYLADRRLPYISRVGRPIPSGEDQPRLPVAYVEEVLLWTALELISGDPAREHDPYLAARADDLRLALAAQPAHTLDVFGGFIRARLALMLAKHDEPTRQAKIERLAARLARNARAHSVPDALPAWQRPADSYDAAAREAFLGQLDEAVRRLVAG